MRRFAILAMCDGRRSRTDLKGRVPADISRASCWSLGEMGATVTRRRPIDREHILQKHIKKFAEEAVIGGEFLAFDRAKKAGRFTHIRERARGVRKGNADTLLRVPTHPGIWCEIKWGKNTPDDDQIEFSRRMKAVGDIWFWTTTVTAYFTKLKELGVQMRANAALIATDHDARVLGEIMREEAKRGAVPKVARTKTVPRFLAGKRFTARARKSGVMF